MPGITLTVYSRAYCHLCDDLISALRSLKGEFSFDIAVVDVDSDPAMEARHGEYVPVLMHGERELCHYFLDEAAVRAYLSEMR